MRLSILKKMSILALAALTMSACQQEPIESMSSNSLTVNDNLSKPSTAKVHTRTITIENVLKGKPLVESGAFMGDGTPPVIFPGQEVSFSFYAGKGQYLSFATMYGWSNDLFFAPQNPGIALYDNNGMPITGDISSQIKLWDNGTRVNQAPGMDVMHPGTLEDPIKAITEINGMDEYANSYPAASDMMKLWLAYEGHSKFTITIMNTSDQTSNTTPFSPGVWAISYAPGGNLLMPEPIFQDYSTEGLTNIAEAGNITVLHEYLQSKTGIFTPLSPILVVVYKDHTNPFYEVGAYDMGEGLKEIAQFGIAQILADHLKLIPNVMDVYVLADPVSTVLLPSIDGNPGSKVSQELNITGGSKIAIATMYGLSNDWFFATKGEDVNALRIGDISSTIGLFDNGTAIDEYPGAGNTQAALGGTPSEEMQPIMEVTNPNAFNTLPDITDIIKVTLE